ncbi:hypothetical protein CLAIMM_11315 [Cladophialophora immunda]|nr:hypothetical protein CLAIMM_11315 [Cladophialophora immunda]
MTTLNWGNFAICFAVSLGQLCFAYPSSIISTTLGQPAFLEYFKLLDSEGKISSEGNSLIGAFNGVFQAGSVFGVVIGGYAMAKWGRKRAMQGLSVVSAISGALLAASQNSAMFTVFRFFSGLGSWAFLVITPVYCSELAQPQYRGLMVGMNGVMIGLGYSIASYIGLAFFYSHNRTAQWRAPLGLAPFFPILMAIVLCFIPESPRYLLMHGEVDKAREVVSKLHATKDDPQQEFARSEFYQMQKQAEADCEMETSWTGIFRKPSYRKRMLVGMGFAFFGQSTGAFVVNNYATVIYSSMGFGSRDQLILACGWISVSIFGNLGGALVVDRFGRKPLMLWAFIGCCFCLTLEAAMVARYAAAGTNKVGLGFALFASYAFSVFYTPGIDCNNAIFLGELFPNHIRAKAVTLCLVVYALTDLVYLQVAPTAFEHVGWKFYLLFIILSALGAVWAWIFVPETKGVPLEEMAAIFGDPEDVVIYLREVHLDHANNKLVIDHHEVAEKIPTTSVEVQTEEHLGQKTAEP